MTLRTYNYISQKFSLVGLIEQKKCFTKIIAYNEMAVNSIRINADL